LIALRYLAEWCAGDVARASTETVAGAPIILRSSRLGGKTITRPPCLPDGKAGWPFCWAKGKWRKNVYLDFKPLRDSGASRAHPPRRVDYASPLVTPTARRSPCLRLRGKIWAKWDPTGCRPHMTVSKARVSAADRFGLRKRNLDWFADGAGDCLDDAGPSSHATSISLLNVKTRGYETALSHYARRRSPSATWLRGGRPTGRTLVHSASIGVGAGNCVSRDLGRERKNGTRGPPRTIRSSTRRLAARERRSSP